MSSSLGSPQGFPLSNSPLTDRNGRVTQPWLQFFIALWSRTGQAPGTIPGTVVDLPPITPFDALSPDGDTLTVIANSLDAYSADDAFTSEQPSLDLGDDYTVQVQQEWPGDDYVAPAQEIWPLDDEYIAPRGAPLELPVVGSSPFTYASARRQVVVISGGTVSTIEFGRDVTTYDTGLTAGMFTLETGDYLIITYAVAPTVFVSAPF